MPPRFSLSANLSTLLRLAALGGASVITLTLLVITWQLAARFDADARLNTQNMVAAGVQAQRIANKVVTRDYAIWTDADTAVRAVDLDWLEVNIGDGAAVTGTMDAVVLSGGTLPGVLGWSDPGLGPLAPEAFETMAQTAADLVHRQGHQPGDSPVSVFVRTGDTMWMLSTTWVQPAEGQAARNAELADPPPAADTLLTVGMAINASFVGRMSELFQIDGLSITLTPQGNADRFALQGMQGPVGYLTWPQPRPGRAALQDLATPIAVAIALTLGALAFGIVAISRLAERLERALQASQVADRAKAEFIASLSHELRTPMNGIVGMLELLQTTEVTPEQSEFISIALASAETQVEMIDHLLAFGQIDSGRLHLSLAPLNPADLIHEVVTLAGPAARDKGLTLELSFQGPVTETILADRLALRQIAVNLIGNAVKFTREGGVQVCLSLRDDLRGRHLSLRVDDTGPGVPLADRDRIFETFVQADASAARMAGGVGLGLSISTRLATQMGGVLLIQDKPGPGSRFVFEAVFDPPALGAPVRRDIAA